MPPEEKRIFLTGATGFLGHYVLAELLTRPNLICRLLVRTAPDEAAATLSALLEPLGADLASHVSTGHIEIVTGRLPESINSDMLIGVDRIIHAAASTGFKSNGLEPYRSNVDGTTALLSAATDAGIRRFCFVSTAYVAGVRSGMVAESILDALHPTASDYERSKWLAENAVWNWAADGRSASIVRPSILIGDRRTGRATSFGGIYVLARTVELLARAVMQNANVDRHAVPLRIIGDPRLRPNLVPVCWAARRLVTIALDQGCESRVHNLVNPESPTSGDLKAWLEEYFDLAGGEFTEMTWPWDQPSRFEEGFYAAGQPIQDFFSRDLSFAASDSVGADRANPLVDKPHFFRCIRYAIRNNWGRAASVARSAVNPSRPAPSLDAAWYFEEFLKTNLPRSRVSQVSSLTAVVRFIVEGPFGGDWTCRYERGQLVEVCAGETRLMAHFGFRVRKHAFDGIVKGAARLQDAYAAGDADIFGDVLTAMKMVPVMEMFLAEFPVRSAA